MPPLAGFAAKFQIFAALYERRRRTTTQRRRARPGRDAVSALLVVGGLNTVISAVYYLKVLKVMILDHRAGGPGGPRRPPLREPVGAVVYAGADGGGGAGAGRPVGAARPRRSRAGVARFRSEPGVDDRQPPAAGAPPAEANRGKGGRAKGGGQGQGQGRRAAGDRRRQNQAVLQDIVRRESRSLLSYIGDAYPWTTAAGGPALARLSEIIRQENDAVPSWGAT